MNGVPVEPQKNLFAKRSDMVCNIHVFGFFEKGEFNGKIIMGGVADDGD